MMVMRINNWFRSLTIAAVLAAACGVSQAQVGIGVSITLAPPALPVYVQPEVPGPNYLWSPGYWAWGSDGYYWVPGTWVQAPQPGLLWTPGYWGWVGGNYIWHGGYWGQHIGFYGGVNYGFGYVGVGYAGGYWNHGAFYYNTAVSHVNTTVVTNVYNKTVINNTTVNRVSYNGGTGGLSARPTAQEQMAEHEQHVAPTAEQASHEHAALNNRALAASVNHGAPPIAATAKPGVFSGKGVVAAHNASFKGAAPNNSMMMRANTEHPPAAQHAMAANHPPAAHNPKPPSHAKAPPKRQEEDRH
jgi:hypothetical protein